MHRLISLFLTVIVLVAGCSSSGDEVTTDAAAPSPTASPVPDSNEAEAESTEETDVNDVETLDEPVAPTPTPTVSPPPTPTTSAPEPTPALSEPTNATPAPEACITAASIPQDTVPADVDGDGALDEVGFVQVGDNEWKIVASAGDAVYAGLVPLEIGFRGKPRLAAVADIDGDAATDELVVTLGSSAAAEIVAVYTLAGCNLVQANQNGFAVTFAIGGTVANLAGLQCLDSDGDGATDVLIAWTGEAAPTGIGDWLLFGTRYQLVGDQLTERGSLSRDANVIEADFAYGQLNCTV